VSVSKRGYFGIGIYHVKTEANIGTLWRSAAILGADFIFTIGRRYKAQASDTMKTPRHIPLYNYVDYDDFFKHVPYDCPVVAVELAENSIPLEKYVHPERCIYLLGAEDHGIPEDILTRCRETVQLIGDYCMNVATAGSIVMYDRAVKGA
jgi:tRNA G18 (ribose-2'-O)-methylase SpoU